MDNRFLRIRQLVGEDAFSRLQSARVAVFGLGGVGSYVAESLARSGVGALDIFDHDKVDITNINRQLFALESTVGQPKAQVAAARLRDINPALSLAVHILFVTPEETEKLDFSIYNYVVDAVDNVTAKISICQKATEQKIPVISAMGAGNKLDPAAFRVAPIEKTEGCPLARAMRSELKKRGIQGVKAVYSAELPKKSKATEAGRRSPTPASIATVPSVAGLILANEVLSDLMKG